MIESSTGNPLPPQKTRLHHSIGRSVHFGLGTTARRFHGTIRYFGVYDRALTLALIEKACRLQPQRAEYAAEHAYQLMLLEDYQTAHSLLRRATSMEEGADVVMIYQIRCLILMGELGEAEQQALFASDMIGRPNPEMM